MFQCWIALGGNLGPVAETFRQAAELLDGTAGISFIRMSQLYTTSPVGADAGEEFLNAAAELRTSLSPLEILATLQRIETQLGRQRTLRWGPRTLDLDLLMYDQQVVTEPSLTVPHPHLWYRRFVLDPLVEIAPHAMHCVHRRNIAELHARLLDRPLGCLLVGGTATERSELSGYLEGETPCVAWLQDRAESAWLAFCLDSAPLPPGLPAANRIDVREFPTTPLQTIRDAIGAAIGDVRVVE